MAARRPYSASLCDPIAAYTRAHEISFCAHTSWVFVGSHPSIEEADAGLLSMTAGVLSALAADKTRGAMFADCGRSGR